MDQHVVIVGASLAGLRTAEGLRRAGHDGPITMVGAETHMPYTRPPLSKQLLSGEWEPEKAMLRPQDKLDGLELEWRLGMRATGVDAAAKVLHLEDGDRMYDALVIATGASARWIPGTDGIAGVHVLRTIDDALALRDELVDGARVVVIGGGFIGAEVASVSRAKGLDVAIVEPLAAPMIRGLGPELGAVAAGVMRRHRVQLHLGVGVERIEDAGQHRIVHLADGSSLEAEVVVIGVGAAPNTAWLSGSAVTVDDGVVCDQYLRAEGVDGIWAAGDVARWLHPTYGDHVRLEHWTVAADHGQAVAQNIVATFTGAELVPHGPVPYVWSDQFGVKIQIIGRAGEADAVEVLTGSVEDHRFLAARVADGVVTGAVGFGQPRPLMQLQMAMEKGPLTLDSARALLAPQ